MKEILTYKDLPSKLRHQSGLRTGHHKLDRLSNAPESNPLD